jgi:proline iminopeptidase
MQELFPDLEPYVRHSLAVTAPHVLYIEECGNPDGIPVLFVHGGPGAGCERYHRRFFDPQRYRIILFDQRGCGRSTPHAHLEHNSTQALIADIEQIRVLLHVEQWLLFGGSWGSTLSLAYAETHPERILGLILRGIFLCRPRDLHWFYQDGANHLFPELWEHYLAPIPLEERGNLMQAFHKRLTCADEIQRMAAAKAWSVWEGSTATLRQNPMVINHFADPYVALALARIENHYFVHDAFLEPDQLLRDASRLANIPGIIVHGRYDVVCPVEQAVALHHVWPQATLKIIDDAGHSATEPGTLRALVNATEDFADRLA